MQPLEMLLKLNPEQAGLIAELAKERHLPMDQAVMSLVQEALELEKEDRYFSVLAEKREQETKTWLSHDDAWK